MKSIKERLEAEVQDEKLEMLKDKVVSLVKMSRGKMGENYVTWDKHNDVYRGVRPLDKEDIDAKQHNEPEKLVVPMSFAQVQTFVSFVFLLFTQNRRFYEFVATGAEDYEFVNDSEELLERDLRRNSWNRLQYQLYLDAARFNVGVVKHWWAVDKQKVPMITEATEVAAQGNGFDYHVAGGEQMVDLVKYEGNKLINISPYNWFPDTRFPLADWKKGSFVADETEWHVDQLRKWERDGIVHGIEWIEPMEKDGFEKRGKTRLNGLSDSVSRSGDKSDSHIVCFTECELDLVPKMYDLGPEEFPVKFKVGVANDDRVISVKRAGYLHDEECYDLAMFSPDVQQEIGASLCDTIYAMQDVVSYLINSRLASVRKSLDHNLILDPSAVDMTTVESRQPYILLQKGAPRMGVDKFAAQLNYTDTTAAHLNDADMIMKIMQMVTGVNENAMGQFHGGRRSATEARAANSGAAARMKLIASVMWQDCLASMGRKMLFNLRQGISEESFVKVLGESARERYGVFSPQDPAMLVGMEDHFVFDSTLQSEKGFMAQSLQELLGAVISNPVVMSVLPLDVGTLMEEILQLRGVDNIERFKLQPDDQANIARTLQQLQQPRADGGSSGPPQV